MAKMEIAFCDDLIKTLDILGDNADEIAGMALSEGAEITAAEMKKQLHGMIGKGVKRKGRSTGTLVDAIGVSSPKKDRNGRINVKVGFSEPRKPKSPADTTVNQKIADVFENGTSPKNKKRNQRPRRFMAKTKRHSAEKSKEAIQRAFDREVKKVLET